MFLLNMYEPKMFLNTFLGWSTSPSDNSSGDDEAAARAPGSTSCSVSVDGLSRYVHGENRSSAAVPDVDGSAYGKDCAVAAVDVAASMADGAQSSHGLSTRAYMTGGRQSELEDGKWLRSDDVRWRSNGRLDETT